MSLLRHGPYSSELSKGKRDSKVYPLFKLLSQDFLFLQLSVQSAIFFLLRVEKFLELSKEFFILESFVLQAFILFN